MSPFRIPLLVALPLLLTTACDSRLQTQISYPDHSVAPTKVVVYIDHSRSMQGYFNGNSQGSEMLSQLTTNLEMAGIPTDFFKFAATPDHISSEPETARMALFDADFFDGQHNAWSASLASICDSLNPGELAIVLSDGVLSPPPGMTSAQEAA